MQVRSVEGFRIAGIQYLVDGYLGLDFLLEFFSFISVVTRQLVLTLRLQP